MNDRSYFVVAVIIALVVPMIFGSIYFFKMKNIKDNTRYVTMLKDKPDLVLDGKTSIEDDSVDAKVEEIKFSVQYVRGEKQSAKFNLYFENVELFESSNGLEWQLYVYDEITNNYILYNSGSLNNKSLKKVILGSNISIDFLSNKKFKLNYSLNDDKGNVEIFKSDIVLEQE